MMEQCKENSQNYHNQQRNQSHHYPPASGNAHLRKVLNVMFPPAYIRLHHRPPNTICSLLSTSYPWPRLPSDQCGANGMHYGPTNHEPDDQELASTEPSSRKSVIILRDHLNSSLEKHQAKSVGLCPIRRAIYDQCFDELIRQVTVCCIEQGLLLFRVRNELRATINYYRVAYEAGVDFGLSKAVEAELRIEKSRAQVLHLGAEQEKSYSNANLRNRISEVELKNKLESVDKLKKYYESEIAKRDQIIEQQRAIIRALSQKFTSEIRGPI